MVMAIVINVIVVVVGKSFSLMAIWLCYSSLFLVLMIYLILLLGLFLFVMLLTFVAFPFVTLVFMVIGGFP